MYRVYMCLIGAGGLLPPGRPTAVEGALVELILTGSLGAPDSGTVDLRPQAARYLWDRWRVGDLYDMSDRCVRMALGKVRWEDEPERPRKDRHHVDHWDPHDLADTGALPPAADPLTDAEMLAAHRATRAQLSAGTDGNPVRTRRLVVYDRWIEAGGRIDSQRTFAAELCAQGYPVRDSGVSGDMEVVRVALSEQIARALGGLFVPPLSGPRSQWKEDLDNQAARINQLLGREPNPITGTPTGARAEEPGPVPRPALLRWHDDWPAGRRGARWTAVLDYYSPDYPDGAPAHEADELKEMVGHYSAWQVFDRAGARGYRLLDAARKCDPAPTDPIWPLVNSAQIGGAPLAAPPVAQLAEWLTRARRDGVRFPDLQGRLGLRDIENVVQLLNSYRGLLAAANRAR
jgi:hypothetical protein